MNYKKNKQVTYIPDGTGDNLTRIAYSNISDTNYQKFLYMKDQRETNRTNFLGWPVLPVQNIITPFGGTITVGDNIEKLEGIQLSADQGQELYAPANGYVYYVQDQDGMTINWMMIVHNNGYVSVFTNLNKILVKRGDIVERGQIIALVGGQAGTRGAGWFSTIPMVNMQLYEDGITIDPLSTLDLSIFNNASMVPSSFANKHMMDSRDRNKVMDFTTVKFVPGVTEREKRNSFLTTYAKPPYDDIVLWEQAAEGTNIDPDLGICIGYAETSLGRAFASANNIGNVGNNDRGDRVDKESPIAGARAIYMTLNNGYLGGYHTIYELSGYGNKYGAIYASSEYNRQKNVSRCLSTIKGYIVPEDYSFRTYDVN